MSQQRQRRTSQQRSSLMEQQSSAPAGSFPSSSVLSTSSSTYRHHQASLQVLTTPSPPRPTLSRDEAHEPKTRGSLGLLVVGLGGSRGTTLVAGILANRTSLKWKGPKGEVRHATYNGCLTQLDAYRDEIKGLADVNMAAVGGWDVCPTLLGDALEQAHILDHNLVSRVKDEMNKVRVFKGYYDERFVINHEGDTTYVLQHSEASEVLKYLRADIRYFKWKQGVVGHTTVIWSCSKERDCNGLPYHTARELLNAIDMSEDERQQPIPPSLLYATAAILEGCSFINGDSQNTLSCCKGLMDLADKQQVYLLGSCFHTGPSRFHAATVEYIQTIGQVPISPSSHAGNNDTKRLAFQNDCVEYTSLGFVSQEHTFMTYTRGSNSTFCVPLMIDAAVWCDFFSLKIWPPDKVIKALAYMFTIPEGATQGVEAGFFHQMSMLKTQAQSAFESKLTKSKGGTANSESKRRVRIRPEEKTTEWAIPHDARIICAGLACVDMQLNQASGGDGGEGIQTFEGEKSIGGGSVSMACKTLARLCHGAPLDDGFMQVTPPVVHSVIPLCKIGNDDTGNKLVSLLEHCGEACRNVDTKYIKSARSKDPMARTGLAVLPIYRDGRRGCFFDAASNASFSAFEMLELMNQLATGTTGPDLDKSELSFEDMEQYQEELDALTPAYGAFLFGYPHLLPKMQGEALVSIFEEARYHMLDGGIVALDLNGVPEDAFRRNGGFRTVSDLLSDPVIGVALEHVDILHMNEDELMLLTGCELEGTEKSQLEDEYILSRAANVFLLCGVAIVAITRGKRGSFVSCNDEKRFGRSKMLPSSWVDCTARIGAAELPPDTVINTNGAGDAFTSGLLVAALLRHTGMKFATPQVTPRPVVSEQSFDYATPTKLLSTPHAKSQKKLTPYQLYMRENYVSLKKQCNDDKKAIFTKCHEMWENESKRVKTLYERRATEENEEAETEIEISMRLVDDLDALDSSTPRSTGVDSNSAGSDDDDDDEVERSLYLTNRALNLESAVLFATLVAAHHIDVSTRDLLHLDVIRLLERSMIFTHGLEEI